MSAPCDPVGIADIADRLGVSKVTVHKWAGPPEPGRRPAGFPPPKWHRSGISLWNWRTVEAWARRTGRLPAATS